jgi:ribosomal protein S3
MKNILTQSLAKNFLPGVRGNIHNISPMAYNFNKNGLNGSVSMLNAQRSAIELIQHFFSPIKALASKPVFTITSNKVIINIFYLMPVKTQALNINTINNLGERLSKLFGRPVELRLVRLHYPYLNSYILAQFVALNTKKYNFVRIQRIIFSKAAIVKDTDSNKALASELPSHIVGIKIRISGRLVTERSRPRQTVQTAEIGSFVKDNKSIVETALYTDKNKKGAFTVKVWISQRINS